MFEIDKSKLIKQYAAVNLYALYIYNLFFQQIPVTTIIPIQLLISLNLIFAGLYALFSHNFILASSNNAKKDFFIAVVTQYALVWELLKLIPESEDFLADIFFVYYLCSVIYHITLEVKYPQFFYKVKKFNFGFTIQYLILIALNTQVNKIIPCTILGVVFIYFSSLSLDHMAVITSNIIFSAVLVEAWIPLVIILSPSNDEAEVLFGFFIAGVATLLIYLVAVILQLRKVNSGAYDGYGEIKRDDDIEEGRAIISQANNTSANNYSTFTN